MSYNLFEGAHDSFDELVSFTNYIEPDVVCLQEANDWTNGEESSIGEFMELTGLEDAVYGRGNSRFNLATLSRDPILESQVFKDGFRHAAIRTAVRYNNGVIDIWNVHLSPSSEDERAFEAKRITDMAHSDVNTVLTGDFNSLSRLDNYPEHMVKVLAARGISKFGDKKLRYTVTDHLKSEDYADAADIAKETVATVPTPMNTDAQHAVPLRLDYMFVSPSLVLDIADFEVPHNILTDSISDHYPLVMELSPNNQKPSS